MSGGLGNQLFQLAYMLWQTKCNDIVPVVHFGRQHKNFNNPGGIELLNLEIRVKNYNNSFAKMIGVPSNELNKIVNGIRELQTKPKSVTQNDASTTVATSTSATVTESKIVKIKDLK